jgi:N-acetylmuramoyl-L-alanine amidase
VGGRKLSKKITWCLIVAILGFFLLPINSFEAAEAISNPVKIVIDPGHGGRDPGAIGVNGIYEKDVNLDIALRLRDLLVVDGYNVVMTRDTDRLLYEYTNTEGRRIDLQARVDVATRENADLFISIHCNSFAPNHKGTLVLYYDSSNKDPQYPASPYMDLWSKENKRLAQSILNSVTSLSGTNPIGARPSNVYVVRNGTVPSVLVETAFLSNAEEAEKLATPEFRQLMAESIRQGIRNYQPVRYVDLIDHWAKNEIVSLSIQGIINGYPDRLFKPNNPLTRAELIYLLDKAKGFEMDERNPLQEEFKDIPDGYWAYDSIVAAKQYGIVKGYPDGTFRPNQTVTREEMAAFLYRTFYSDLSAMTQNPSVVNEVYGSEQPIFFEDVPNLHWASKEINTLALDGVIKGIRERIFGLGERVTRAEAATMIYRLLN